MMKFKKNVELSALVVLTMLILAACNGKKEAASAAAPVALTKLTICGTNGIGDTQSMAHEEFARRLNALGGWDAVAKVSSEMGSTDDVTEQALDGSPVIAATDPSRLAVYVPEFGVLMMPFLLSDYSQLDNLMDTALYKEWTQKLRDQGLVLLTNNCLTGWRNWVTNKPIRKPDDLKGLKIRTMGNPIAVNSVNAMGAVATPMNQNECYNAITTKVIDGGEWQLPTIYSSKFYEVCKNISLSHHFLLTGSIVAGTAWYDTLSKEQQTQLSDTAVKTYKDNQAIVLEYEKKYLDEMRDKFGVAVEENPDREAFRAATAYLYADKATTGGADFEALRTELYKQLGI
jgi:TRAP-type C4-dicarboxylate transport system substrate-binding protein